MSEIQTSIQSPSTLLDEEQIMFINSVRNLGMIFEMKSDEIKTTYYRKLIRNSTTLVYTHFKNYEI